MKRITIFQSITKDKKFDVTFTGSEITPLNTGDSLDMPSNMSPTGFVRFIPVNKNVFIDTRTGDWTEITTFTGQFLIISRDEK